MTTALVPLEPKAAMSMAQAYASAKMVPAHFKNSPGDALIAVQMAHRFGMDPFMLMLEMYVINGRPMLSGKLTAAIVNHNLAEPLTPVYSGEGDNRKITITGRVEGREPQTIELTVKQAKTSNEQWTKNPDQMLFYAGSRQWARRYTPASILGIVFDDEVDTTPAGPRPIAELPPIQSHPQLRDAIEEVIDRQTGEVTEKFKDVPPYKIELGGDPPTTMNWRAWGEEFAAHIKLCNTIDDVDAWLQLNQDGYLAMKKDYPRMFGALQSAIDTVKEGLVNK